MRSRMRGGRLEWTALACLGSAAAASSWSARGAPSALSGQHLDGAAWMVALVVIVVAVLGAHRRGLARAAAEARAIQLAAGELRRRNEHLEARVADELAENVLMRSQLSQVQQIQALGYLSANVAHDLNNVLQVVSGAADMIGRRCEDPASVQRFAAVVRESAMRGSTIIRRLLPFARRRASHVETLDPGALLTELAQSFGQNVGFATAWRQGRAPAPPAIAVDRAQFEAVLLTLLVSVRDAAPPGRGALTLDVVFTRATQAAPDASGLAPGDYVGFVVEIAAGDEDESRATTQPFASDPFGDTGHLGLAIARDFAARSGGALVMEGGAAGATARLWLPTAERPGGQRPVPAEVMPASEVAGGRYNVLVVDDQAPVRQSIAEILADAGHGVYAATDGASALARIDSGKPIDLLISDLTMPGMDGLAVIEGARRRRPGLPAILLTGRHDESASLALGGALGGTYTLLAKPVSRSQLLARVAAMLDDGSQAARVAGFGATEVLSKT